MKKLISLISVLLMACGGGGSDAPVISSPTVEQTKPWTNTHVQGTVATWPLVCADKKDTEERFFNNTISGNWGTLGGMEGLTHLPNVTGYATPYWWVENGLFHFISQQPIMSDGFAILTKDRFNPANRIVVEATFEVQSKGEGAFAGITIIAGEGDYREIAFRRAGDAYYINRVAPCDETLLIKDADGKAKFTLEYIPGVSWNYFIDGVLVKQEPITEPHIALSGPAHIGLYFVAYKPDGYIKGTVSEIGYVGVLSTD